MTERVKTNLQRFGHMVVTEKTGDNKNIIYMEDFFRSCWRRRWGIKSGAPCLYMEDSFS